jgi:hypothetical protein
LGCICCTYSCSGFVYSSQKRRVSHISSSPIIGFSEFCDEVRTSNVREFLYEVDIKLSIWTILLSFVTPHIQSIWFNGQELCDGGGLTICIQLIVVSVQLQVCGHTRPIRSRCESLEGKNHETNHIIQ